MLCPAAALFTGLLCACVCVCVCRSEARFKNSRAHFLCHSWVSLSQEEIGTKTRGEGEQSTKRKQSLIGLLFNEEQLDETSTFRPQTDGASICRGLLLSFCLFMSLQPLILLSVTASLLPSFLLPFLFSPEGSHL